MHLDMVEMYRLGHARDLIERARVVPQFGEIHQAVAIAFEVAVVDRIETQQRREEPPVCFGDLLAKQEGLRAETALEPVKHREQLLIRFLIGGLRCGEAGAIDAVVDRRIDLRVQRVDVRRRLGKQSFLLGEQVTEADWRLLTTLLRFDAVYYGHFKCNRDRLVDFPELWDYTRTLYQVPGVAETVHFDHIKTHYYGSHRTINPTGIIPAGPRVDFTTPTRRAVPKLGG